MSDSATSAPTTFGADPDENRLRLMALAHRCGLGSVRFAPLSATPDMAHYDRFLADGRHADMDYLVRGRSPRAAPADRLAGANTVAVFSLRYDHAAPPDPGGLTGRVARYAWGRDYHNILGKGLKKLRRDLRAEGVKSWGGVDTPPILERAWAKAAGVGFSGKSTLIISPGRTSYQLLAVLFVDVPVTPDAAIVRDHCGSCVRCLVACPTQAFVGPHTLDARRCLSYWTIESHGLAPRALRRGFGRWFFGCDVCQEVCPHNTAPPPREHEDLRPRHAWVDLPALLQTPDDVLMERFIGTPLRRPGGSGLKRNALIVLGNLGDDRAVPVVRTQLTHPSPVVRAAAVWALAELGDYRVVHHQDPDPTVRDEVTAATLTGEATPK